MRYHIDQIRETLSVCRHGRHMGDIPKPPSHQLSRNRRGYVRRQIACLRREIAAVAALEAAKEAKSC